jgi:hypothetical protein
MRKPFFKKTIWMMPVLVAFEVSVLPAAEVFEAGGGREVELPGGKEADGIRGDFVLRSDRVEAVISANLVNRRANMSTFYGEDGISPGCLYDLTLRGKDNDQLVVYGPLGHGPVSYVRELPGEAAVESVTSAALNKGVLKRHVYRVEDGVSGVFVRTELTNQTDAEVKLALKDDLARFNSRGEIEGAVQWMDAINPAHRCGYALVELGIEGGRRDDGGLTVAAGETAVVNRFFAVGESPAAAVGEVLRVKGDKVMWLHGKLVDEQGNAVEQAVIEVGFGSKAQVVQAYSGADGEFALWVPAGTAAVKVATLGREAVELGLKAAGEEVDLGEVKLAAAARVRFQITAEDGGDLPCKAMFAGVEGTVTPNLGPRERAHGCVDQYHSETGFFTVELPPGRYEIAVLRGPEYGRLSQVLEVKPGEEVVFAGVLKRLVDTSGWISADFHNHSTPSGDNVCDVDGRIINLAAEHIEFAPTTEHNRLFDWEPTIVSLGLTPFIKTVKGLELTGRGQHVNAFPFEPDGFLQDGGAPVWDADPRITALRLRGWQGGASSRWIQFNHPDLAQNFFDRDNDGIVDGGFVGVGGMIDGTETQNFSDSQILYDAPFRVTRSPGAVAAKVTPVREFVWRQLLNQGHRLVAVAVADAHTVYGNGVGGWRIYLPSSTDEPSELDWEQLSSRAKAGNVILSSGPFLEVSAGAGKMAGEDVRGNGGVELKVRVQCTDWLDVDHVQVLVNSRALPQFSFTRESHPQMFQDGVVKFDQSIWVPLEQDAHLIVVAQHRSRTLEAGFGSSDQSRLRPVAYNNPIYVDVDGNGFQANGDTLGFDLRGSNLSADAAREALQRAGME